ncbi:MAG TPA: efflux RND transporter periplasmic adaptor subunit [Treponema sp.]|nr:efflux RND transporter periplasmic adaptor subunit [Treponema sp.]
MNMRNIKRAAAAAAVFAVVLGGCKTKNSDSGEAEARFAVNTYKTSAGSLDDYLEFGGDVVASSVVNILPDTAGKVSRKLVTVGDFVKKDQILAYIDPSRPGMTYSENPVKAPVEGTVTSFPLSVGATVSPAAPLGQISSTGRLEIQVNVSERFVSRIKGNQSAVITLDAYPGEKFSARVFEISPALDTSTRTLRVKLMLEQPDPRLRAGMYARVRLITEKLSNVIVIPYDALVARGDKSYVFAVERTASDAENAEGNAQTGTPAVVHLREVTPGIHVDDKLEISAGLKTGDEIVVRGQSLLNDGSKVNVMTAE